MSKSLSFLVVLAVTCLFISFDNPHCLAAPVIRGTVVTASKVPLADVEVLVELRAKARRATSTGAAGKFTFDLGSLFSPEEISRADHVMIRFSKPGFQWFNWLKRLRDEDRPAETTLEKTIQLIPEQGTGALDASLKQKLDKHLVRPGSRPIFILPYSIELGQQADGQKVNESLRSSLERVIIAHIQAADLRAAQGLSVKSLPVDEGRDSDRLQVYGDYLGALAVVTGNAAPNSADAGKIEVGSTYVMIPKTEKLTAPVLYVDDEFSATLLTSPRLYQHLNKLWGRYTLLAVATAEYHDYQAAKARGEALDKSRLDRVKAYLESEKRNLEPDPPFKAELDALLHAVEQELIP